METPIMVHIKANESQHRKVKVDFPARIQSAIAI